MQSKLNFKTFDLPWTSSCAVDRFCSYDGWMVRECGAEISSALLGEQYFPLVSLIELFKMVVYM